MQRARVLFVCMGNICRSPTAHGVMRHLVAETAAINGIHIDSAGTHAWHVNEPPDPRAQAAAVRRGIDISDLRARAVEHADFYDFDLILAMDRENLAHLQKLQPADAKAEVKLMLSYAGLEIGEDVPDPYYGGSEGFEDVLDMLEAASQGLLGELLAE